LTDPPYGAQIKIENVDPGEGWNAPPLEKYLEDSLNNASLVRNFIGKPLIISEFLWKEDARCGLWWFNSLHAVHGRKSKFI